MDDEGKLVSMIVDEVTFDRMGYVRLSGCYLTPSVKNVCRTPWLGSCWLVSEMSGMERAPTTCK